MILKNFQLVTRELSSKRDFACHRKLYTCEQFPRKLTDKHDSDGSDGLKLIDRLKIKYHCAIKVLQ